MYSALDPGYGGSRRRPRPTADTGAPSEHQGRRLSAVRQQRRPVGLGIPLPAGRVRVSQLDTQDDTLEFIGEDVLDHTPKDETVSRRARDSLSTWSASGDKSIFKIDEKARRMEETIEIELRNHKQQPVDVTIREPLYRARTSEILESTTRYERPEAGVD